MILAFIFGVILFLAIIWGDWYQFTSLHGGSSRSGLGVAKRADRMGGCSVALLKQRFDQQGWLQLPHGVARWCQDMDAIVIRPSYQLFSMRFRTAWPLKGTIEVKEEEGEILLQLIKRMPWSSALLTILWLAVVLIGTLTFLVMFVWNGGFESAGGVMLALGILGLGVLVLVFGLVLVSLAYRLEDHRLMQVYQELREVLETGTLPN